MNFEEHMRTWSGYENAQLYLDPTTAKLVAEVISWARELRHELEDFDAEARVRIQEFDKAIEALDAHHAKEKA